MRLILASASPRRAELLAAAGIPFEVWPADVDESRREGEPPYDYAVRLARAKAQAVRADSAATQPDIPHSDSPRPDPPASDTPEPHIPKSDTIVLGADTIVIVDGACLGKPRDAADAAGMLNLLSGRTHEVVTGLALVHAVGTRVDLASTRVSFQTLTADEIAWYVGTGEPTDKAGAYGIQGGASRFVTRIEGSYSNVVGLPVELVYRNLCALGFDLAWKLR